MSAPAGINELAGVVAAAKVGTTVTLPAVWLRALLQHVEALEADLRRLRDPSG